MAVSACRDSLEDCWLSAQGRKKRRVMPIIPARRGVPLPSPAAELTAAALLGEPKRANTFFGKVVSSQGKGNGKPPRRAAHIYCTIWYVQFCLSAVDAAWG